jgi:hypothetical protein
MAIKIGDKIRFLNSVGGGVVSSFKNKDIVMVLEDDGFETPALIRNCVIINDDKKLEEPFKAVTQKKEVEKKEIVKVEKIQAGQSIINRVTESREGEFLNISLAFLPAEGKSFIEGCFECYLINDSNYDLIYNIASCSGKSWKSRSAGQIEANSKLFIEEFGKDVISEFEKVSFQAIAFKPGRFYNYKNAISAELRIDTVKFYKLHCFRENDYFDEDALIVNVIKNDQSEKSFNISPEEIKKAMLEKEADKPRISIPIDKKISPLEVDLHINNLLDSTAGMGNKEILEYQLKVFHQTMNENIKNKGFKIVFIHGKGDGVLRAALVNELKNKYKSCKYQDASFREYGFGATQVTIY